MKKLYSCFLILLCIALTGCNSDIFKETSVQIYNKCPWELYLNISGDDFDESFTVGKTSKRVRLKYNVEYKITISSPYDYSPWTIKTSPSFGTKKWTFEWSSYKGCYTLSQD